MTDREMLELAAKAAGWKSWDWLAGDGVLNVYGEDGRHDTFYPLEDDGDALRLAVKLRLIVMTHAAFTAERPMVIVRRVPDVDVEQPFGTDINAAVRRAITRAAASIGAAMQPGEKP